ncbi:hypothetical protein RIEGSTA812A_PEG_667 [invertebrate metagenome]|uniref:Uncharacterized protein n=1 Tax=invertebrate metagenome TaxID=1711999 RepID=A0A484H6J2_9ZZZZ
MWVAGHGRDLAVGYWYLVGLSGCALNLNGKARGGAACGAIS